MAFDLNSFKNSVASVLKTTTTNIRKYTPESFSGEKQFLNALVASLALMVMADKKVENSEVTDAMAFINNMDVVKELNLGADAIELFSHHIEILSTMTNDNIKWIMEINKILNEIRKIKDNMQYKNTILGMLDIIAGSDGNIDSTELDMKNKIIDVLK